MKKKRHVIEKIIDLWYADLQIGKTQYIRDYLEGLNKEQVELFLMETTTNDRNALNEVLFYQLMLDLKYTGDTRSIEDLLDTEEYNDLLDMAGEG